MSNKVESQGITNQSASPLEEGLKWRIKKPGADVSTGLPYDSTTKSEKNTAEGMQLKNILGPVKEKDNSNPEIKPTKVTTSDGDSHPKRGEGKKLPEGSEGLQGQKQQAKYQEAKAHAHSLQDLSSGQIARSVQPQQTQAQPQAGIQNGPQVVAQNNQPASQPANPANIVVTQNAQTQAQTNNAIGVQPFTKSAAKNTTAPKTNNAGPDVATLKGPQDNAKNTVETLGQTPIPIAGREEESKQPNDISADNEDKVEKEEEESSKSSPFAKARSAGNKLDGLVGGLGGGGSGNPDWSDGEGGGYEAKADRIEMIHLEDPELPIQKKEAALGIKIYNKGDLASVGNMLAAREFKDMTKLLQPYLPLDQKVENWKPDRGIVDRIVADTQKDIEEARKYLNLPYSVYGRFISA